MDRRFKPELPQLQAPVVEAAPQIAPELQAIGAVADAFSRGDVAFLEQVAAGELPEGIDPAFSLYLGTTKHLGPMMIAANEALNKGDRNTHGDGTVTTSVDDERLAAQQAAEAARGGRSAAESLVNDMRTGAADQPDGFGVNESRIGRDGVQNDTEVDGLLARLRAGRGAPASPEARPQPTQRPEALPTRPTSAPLPGRPAAPTEKGNGLHFVFDGAGVVRGVPTDGGPTRALGLGSETTRAIPRHQAAHAEEPRERVGRHAAASNTASEEPTHLIRRPQHPSLDENTQRLVASELAGRLDETHRLPPSRIASALGGAGLGRRANTMPQAATTGTKSTVDPGATTQKLWPQTNQGRGRHAAASDTGEHVIVNTAGVGETTKRLPTAAAMRPVRLGEELPPSANPTVRVTAALQLGLGALRDRAGLVRPLDETTKQKTTGGMESTRVFDGSTPVGGPGEVTQQIPTGQMPREFPR